MIKKVLFVYKFIKKTNIDCLIFFFSPSYYLSDGLILGKEIDLTHQ